MDQKASSGRRKAKQEARKSQKQKEGEIGLLE